MNTANSPDKISVIVAAFNLQGALKRCIKSIQNQTYQDLEIIIINDCSGDNTLDIANQLSMEDPRIIVIDRLKNGGAGAARNSGLDCATGDWVAIVDADDTIFPKRLETLLKTAQEQKCDIVCDNLIYTSKSTDKGHPYIPINSNLFGAISFKDYVQRFSRKNPAPTPGFLKPLIRRDLLETHNIRYKEHVPIGEDSLLIYELLIHGANLHIVPDTLYAYKQDEDSLSGNFTPERIEILYTAYEAFLSTNKDKISNDIDSDFITVIEELKSFLKIEKFRRQTSINTLSDLLSDRLALQLFLKMAHTRLKRKIRKAG